MPIRQYVGNVSPLVLIHMARFFDKRWIGDVKLHGNVRTAVVIRGD
jgi:hypothetical protein